MNDSSGEYSAEWENDEVRVVVPYSVAGVATSMVIYSKFTGKMMLCDVGDGVLRDLLSLGSTNFVKELDLITITHGHFDHIGGMHSLLGFIRMLGREEQLHILVPRYSTQSLEMIQAFKDSYPETVGFNINVHELIHGSGFDTDFFKISSFEVEHYGLECKPGEEKLMPALGYRFRVGQTIIAYTGDTRPCPGVKEVVRDADIAFIEATKRKTPKDGSRVHLSFEEAEELGKIAKEYVLIHGPHALDTVS